MWSSACVGQGGDELVEWGWDLDWVPAELDADGAAGGGGDLLMGHDGDVAEGLGVEEHEAASDAVAELEAGVVE